MALGFGFNKAKVLASAEKYVQQGKLQNAITEYEKVVKEDHKDLTVLNTIGDLYSRVGNNAQAVVHFKKVGEAYAHDGFTVKAIAMYKKITKLEQQPEYIGRLAELYTVQGLYNDARQQYVQVADWYLKNNNNDDAAKTFQKILELDPDNTVMQQRLADLYIKLGKKTEARNIFFTAAQSLYSKQAMDGAEEALAKVLELDPKNVDALLLRGAIAAESGDGQGAVNFLSEIPDLDSRPDALRTMLRAQIQLNKLEEAAPLATKLINVHNDLSGVNWYADALLNSGKFVEGVKLYQQHADKMLAANGPAMMKSLNAVIGKVKDSSEALEALRNLFLKANDTSHNSEIMELLAHAYTTEQKYQQAKDLYQELAKMEPENPLHQQNYKQVMALMGDDPVNKPMTAAQAEAPFVPEELGIDQTVPSIKQDYPNDVQMAVQQAITDAELFDSYNLPAKAIPVLEAALPKAPHDVQINLRLVGLYVKVNRFMDAARASNILKNVYHEHGQPEESQKHAQNAAKYLEQAASSPAAVAAAPEPVAAAPVEAAVQDFGFSVEVTPPSEAPAMGFEVAPPAAATAEPTVGFINLNQAAAPPVPPPPAPVAKSEPAVQEISMDEWESSFAVESTPPPAAPVPEDEAPAFSMEVTPPAPVQAAPAAAATFDLSPSAEPAVTEFSFESTAAPEPVMEVAPPAPVAAAPPPPPPPPVQAAPPPPPPPVAKPAPPSPPPPAPKAAPAPPPAAKAAPAAADDLLGDLVSDLEDSLGDGFDFGGPPAKTPAKPAAAAPPPPPASVPPAASMSAAAAAPAPPPIEVTKSVEEVPTGFSSMAHEIPTEKPEIAHHEAADALTDMFSEFKEDVEETQGQAEDPDTHYNLGIAFKEMGLLDEAIGELQKVCHAIEHGHPFDQGVQAYTWLAQCLVDKGVPQAAIRWYEKALKMPNMNEESRLSVYYDMGSAYEMAGDTKKAYNTFMEVYSSNIDFRDVADRVKALKQ